MERNDQPECLEQPSQEVGPRDTDKGKHSAHPQVLRQRRVQSEGREDQHLRDDRDAVADGDVGDGLKYSS